MQLGGTGFAVKVKVLPAVPFTPAPPGLPWRSSFVMSMLTAVLGVMLVS